MITVRNVKNSLRLKSMLVIHITKYASTFISFKCWKFRKGEPAHYYTGTVKLSPGMLKALKHFSSLKEGGRKGGGRLIDDIFKHGVNYLH